MVLVVEAVAGLALGEVQQVGAGGEDLGPGEYLGVGIGALQLDAEELLDLLDLRAQLAVQLVATDPGEVVAARLEEGVAQVGASGLHRRRLTGTDPLVDLQEGLLLGGSDVLVLLPLPLEVVEVTDETVQEAGLVLLVVAQRPKEREHREATLASHPGAGCDVLAGLLLNVELDPLATVGMDGPGHQLVLGQVAEAVPIAGLEDDAG